MIQRAGRIDRIGSPFKNIYVYNFFPEDELEELKGYKVVCMDEEKFEEIYELEASQFIWETVYDWFTTKDGICVAATEEEAEELDINWFMDDSILGQGIPNVVVVIGGFMIMMMFMQMMGGGRR